MLEDNPSSWFRLGARALAAFGPYDGDSYACPLCLEIFPRDRLNELSVEHVPPLSVGGKPLVLTCKRCNNDAGYKVDSHEAHLHDASRFFSGKSGFRPAQLSVGDATVNVQANLGCGYVAWVDSARNSPSTLKEFHAAIESLAQSRETPKISWAYRPRAPVKEFRVNLSRLRAAYLAAFALFGYTFIIREVFSRLRYQLQNPEEELLTHVGYSTCDSEGPGQRFYIVREPPWLRSLASRSGRWITFLPLLDDVPCIYQALKNNAAVSDSLGVHSALSFSWPSEPQFLFDLAPQHQAEEIMEQIRLAAISSATDYEETSQH